jgi:AraC-like DNA-binding protein
MIFDEILDKLSQMNGSWLPKKRFHYSDLVPDVGKQGVMTFYPDRSRSFDDLFSMICMITGEGSPFMSVFGKYLFHYSSGSVEIFFEDGYLPPPYKHNYRELDYVMKGQFHKQIEGKDYVFNQGDFLLINQDISHSDYLYRKKQAVLTLQLSNAFFDKSTNHNDMTLAGKESEAFLRRFILSGNRDYCFIRFAPSLSAHEKDASRIPGIFEQILDELSRPRPGGVHIVMGYVERLLSLLPLDYQVSVEWRDRKDEQKHHFEEIRRFLEERYKDVLINDLVKAFGHSIYYFSRLIKCHTGMTYSAFLQNIRLEKAELLLKTTEFQVEEIAHRVGYENLSYFYKIFTNKFKMKPSEMRKTSFEAGTRHEPLGYTPYGDKKSN